MSEMQYKNAMPVLPLRDVVVLPRMVITLYVGRALSLTALEIAMKEGGQVFLVTQKSADLEEPEIKDLYNVGCVANVLQMLRMPDDSIKVLVEGTERARAEFRLEEGKSLFADLTRLPMHEKPEEEQCTAMNRTLLNLITTYAKTNRKIGDELIAKIGDIKNIERLTDNIIGHFSMPIELRQQLFEESDYHARVEALLKHIGKETEMQKIEQKIRGRVKKQVEKNHREYFLQEQARAIQKELGDDQNKELDELKNRIKKAGLSPLALKKCEQELKKLRMMPPMSSEATVTRSYLETLLSLPWKKRSTLSSDIEKARQLLDTDHYGLDKVKENVLEYLAVQKRVVNGKAPILCFVGPPGVGKTSLGKSIAAATQRVYGRIALGGVRDEAEIRGHRRTYIGAMPGKIANAMIRAEVKNPLILLDEIDKMGYDFRGDPSAALLEVLDPEQNNTFSDHYIEVDYDLSEVMFVTTANTMNIPPALMDRLEIIHLSGYTEEEKIHIASNHLIPRQFKETGLKTEEAQFRSTATRDVIRYYTSEAGVRSLERSIGKICRKVVLQSERDSLASKKKTKATTKIAKATKTSKAADKKTEAAVTAAKLTTITPQSLNKYLGAQRYRFGIAGESKVGQVNGLAWTESGGDLLSVEACAFPGKGNIIRTGKLGEVIKESVEAAFSLIRARASDLNLPANFMKTHDFHIHFPEGAIPKDGPSAGIAIATAILSLVSNVAVRSGIAMTGEITLRGEVLPIGGVKEKLLAATRGGITHVLLPKENEKDMAEIPANVKSKLTISFVKWIDEVFALALEESLAKKKEDPIAKKAKTVASRVSRRKTGQTPPLTH